MWENKGVVKKCNTETLLGTLARENKQKGELLTEINEIKQCFCFGNVLKMLMLIINIAE